MLTQRQVTCESSLSVVGFLLLCGLPVACTAVPPRLDVTPATIQSVESFGPGQEFVTLNTRSGVTVTVLVATPKAAQSRVVVLLPGGQGHISRSGYGFSHAFQPFAEQGFIASEVGPPSDQAGGISPEFRNSNEHLEDIQKVVSYLNKKYSKPTFLLGHSWGAFSAARAASVLKDPHIKGIMLAGMPTCRGPRRAPRSRLSICDLMNGVSWRSISHPVLVVHHRDDGCSNFDEARRSPSWMTSSPRVNFIEVYGGKPEETDPCRGWKDYHGFYGLVHEVVKAITDWTLGNPVPKQIGP